VNLFRKVTAIGTGSNPKKSRCEPVASREVATEMAVATLQVATQVATGKALVERVLA